MQVRAAIVSSVIVLVAIAAAAPRVAATQERVGGPPPEIRALVDAVLQALTSGSADAFEALSQARFSPVYLEKMSPPERKAMYETFWKQHGPVTFERVLREGPDEPLNMHLQGKAGAVVVSLDVDQSGGAPLITKLTITSGKGTDPNAGGVPAPPIRGSMPTEELLAALDQYLTRLTDQDVFSGVALVAQRGAALFQKGYGLADRGNRLPNTSRTRFNIGSINKSFTELAIGQLVSQGRLRLTDTLGALLPDYPQATSRPATVEQLLNHSAGLPDFFGAEFERAAKDRFRSNADYFAFVSARPPLFAPGARRQYCNGCYIALGAIIERVSGLSYEDYVRRHVFRVADMAATDFLRADEIHPDVAIGYTRRGGGGELRRNTFMHGVADSAAGGAYATAGDLLSYVNARQQGRLAGSGMMDIAGGAPGTSAVIVSDKEWTVIVLSNLDPRAGEQIGLAIARALRN